MSIVLNSVAHYECGWDRARYNYGNSRHNFVDVPHLSCLPDFESLARFGDVMGDRDCIVTGTAVIEHGIYQSCCACRTALTLLADQLLPACLGCDEAVEWKLVQKVQPSQITIKPSTTRLKAAKRAQLDSASGDD
jgi:hypothetical protein